MWKPILICKPINGVDDVAVGGDVGEGLGPVLLDPGRGLDGGGGGERRLALEGRGRGGAVDVHRSGGGGARHGGAGRGGNPRVGGRDLGGRMVGANSKPLSLLGEILARSLCCGQGWSGGLVSGAGRRSKWAGHL